MRKLLIARLGTASSALSLNRQAPATFDDVLNIKAVQGATISPDGRQVIYTRAPVGVRAGQDGGAHARLEGRHRRQRAGAADHVRREGRQPAAVLSRRQVHQLRVGARQRAKPKSQIYLMPIDGGEAWKLTDAKENVSSYSWAPDGIADRVCRHRPAQRRGRSQHQEAR